MDIQRAQASLDAARFCLERRSPDSAVSRAYFAIFQMAVCALEHHGVTRREWTHKGVHGDFVHAFVQRRKVVHVSYAGALSRLMQLRHIADYKQPGVSQRQAERAVRIAQGFVEILMKEVLHVQER